MIFSKVLPYIKCSKYFEENQRCEGEGAFFEIWLCVQKISRKNFAARKLEKLYGHDAMLLDSLTEVSVLKTVGHHPFLLTIEDALYEREIGKIISITELKKKIVI